MNLRRLAAVPALLALAAALVAAWGCNKKPTVPLVGGNQPPTVRITSAPLDTTARNYYVITVNWLGNDPDGRVDHFLFAVDPPTAPGQDTLWQTTTDNTLTRSYPCPLPDKRTGLIIEQDGDTLYGNSSDFHVFVIKAVDNKGAMSPPVSRAFWSYTVAPRVEVRTPPARSLVRYYVPPSVVFRWEGSDDDGVFTQKPVKYKFRVLTSDTEVSLTTARADPDSVRRYYAPRHWAGWDSLPGDTTQKQYTNLTVDQEYVFVVVAFDEAGAYSPIFNFDTNMIYFRVTYAGAQNPLIGIFNDFFLYEYERGTHRPNDPSQEVPLEVPAGRIGRPEDKLVFNWYAKPVADRLGNPIGGDILSYRWGVDIVNVFDETARSDEETDLSRWSQKSLLVTNCRIGPYPGGETHRFFLEVEDINNLKSLGVVRFTTVQASFDKELAIVDDTRYLIDRVQPNTQCTASANRPIGNWPTAAELDTFLYAVGSVPWKCYPPVGGQTQLSSPGIFKGYPFDTISTRIGVEDLTVKLSVLGQYRHVLWLLDAGSSSFDGRGSDVVSSQTALRYMNDVRKTNTLAAYVRQGGKVWLAGGGAAAASMRNFNRTINDNSLPPPRTLTFRDTDQELLPGRFVYDQGHWRTEFKLFRINTFVRRYLGRFQSTPGGYAGLPLEIRLKTSTTDPFPPNRTGQSQSVFYQTQFDVEFLSAPNEILEDLDPGPLEDFQSTLDTLYKVSASSLQPDTGPGALQSVAMTRYHGLDNQEFIITGFNIWNFRRQNCIDFVDFVLQNIWGIQRTPVPRGPSAAGFTASPRRPAAPGASVPRWSAPAEAPAVPSRTATRGARSASPATDGSRN